MTSVFSPDVRTRLKDTILTETGLRFMSRVTEEVMLVVRLLFHARQEKMEKRSLRLRLVSSRSFTTMTLDALLLECVTLNDDEDE